MNFDGKIHGFEWTHAIVSSDDNDSNEEYSLAPFQKDCIKSEIYQRFSS